MASTYRTSRKKIAIALSEKIKELDGSHPYNINVYDNVSTKMLFLDEIEQYPKVCVVAGDEEREYQPGGFKWRFLTLTTTRPDQSDIQSSVLFS